MVPALAKARIQATTVERRVQVHYAASANHTAQVGQQELARVFDLQRRQPSMLPAIDWAAEAEVWAEDTQAWVEEVFGVAADPDV